MEKKWYLKRRILLLLFHTQTSLPFQEQSKSNMKFAPIAVALFAATGALAQGSSSVTDGTTVVDNSPTTTFSSTTVGIDAQETSTADTSTVVTTTTLPATAVVADSTTVTNTETNVVVVPTVAVTETATTIVATTTTTNTASAEATATILVNGTGVVSEEEVHQDSGANHVVSAMLPLVVVGAVALAF